MGRACRIACTAAYETNIKTEWKADFPLEWKFAVTEQNPLYSTSIQLA